MKSIPEVLVAERIVAAHIQEFFQWGQIRVSNAARMHIWLG
jgi:hypothetical protein